MIESPPKMTAEYLSDLHIADEDSLLIDKCNSQYLYWDTIKYQKIPVLHGKIGDEGLD